MKQINFTLIIVFIATLAFSQNAKGVKASKGIDQFTVSVTSENHYTSGTTLDLNFILDYQTLDWEYGDFISLTFPFGITPNGSPTDPFALTNEGQDPEYLNGVSGQEISWGDNSNYWGGIEIGLHPFIVNVTIDAGVTGDQVIDILVSGDEYGTPQGDVYTTCTIQEMPTTPDLSVIAGSIEYTNFPLAQASYIPVSAEVSNSGTDLTDETDLVVTCDLASYLETAAISIPLPNGGSETLTLSDITSITEGTHEIIFEANAPGDPYPSNNSDTITFGVDSVYAHDDGGIAYVYGSSNFLYSIGIIFDIITDDDLTAVQFYLAESASIGNEFSLSVCPVTTSGETFTCGDPVWESEDIYVDASMQDSWTTVDLQDAALLEVGEYALFIHEHSSSSIELGHDGNNEGDILMSVNGENFFWEDETYGWAMLRLVLGAPTSGIANDVGVSAIVSPNSGTNLSNAETVTITITNFGTEAQSDIEWDSYYIDTNGDDQGWETGTVAGPIATGESMTFDLVGTADLSVAGEYVFISTTYLDGDEDSSNDQTIKTVINVIESDDCESFDDLTVGGYVAEQLGGLWTTWSGTPGTAEDAMLSDMYSSSPDNSFVVDAGTIDLIYQLDAAPITSGQWLYSNMVYIPAGFSGYFNVQSDPTPGVAWVVEIFFNDDGTGNVTENTIVNEFTYAQDTWILVEINFDLDNGGAEVLFDGVEFYQWENPAASIGGIDFFGWDVGGAPGAYYDDVCFSDEGWLVIGVEEQLASTTQLYPNPATDVVNITSEYNMESVTVYNFAGQLILTEAVNNTTYRVNTSKLDSGIYLFQIETKEGRIAKRIIIE